MSRAKLVCFHVLAGWLDEGHSKIDKRVALTLPRRERSVHDAASFGNIDEAPVRLCCSGTEGWRSIEKYPLR